MKKTFLFLLPALLPAALLAADMTFEGRWLADGVPQATNDTTCTVQFYESAAATNSLASRTNVAFRTGPDGRFVISASVPTNLPDVFWAGVTPKGKKEIAPRMRVAPVPFALVAAEAELVTNATIVLTGTTTVVRAETTGNFTVDHLVLPKEVFLAATNLLMSSVQMDRLTMQPGASLRLFEAGTDTLSPDYDAFVVPDDQMFEAETCMAANWERTPQSYITYWILEDGDATKEWTFESDGILLVAFKTSYGTNALRTECEMNCIGQDFPFSFRVHDGVTTMRKRFLSIPYRAGETVKINLKALGPSSDRPKIYEFQVSEPPSVAPADYAWIGVKVRLIPFGLRPGKDQ